MVSVVSNSSLKIEEIISLSVILISAMGIISAVFILVFHKIEKAKQEFQERKLDLEEKKIALESAIKAQQAKMTPLDTSPLMRQIASSPIVKNYIKKYMEKAIKKLGEKEK